MAAKRSTSTQGVLVRARIPMGYMGDQLDRGQVVPLNEGAPNNRRLFDLRYIELYEGDPDKLHECNQCGAKFEAMGFRDGHGKLRHPDRPRNPFEEDRVFDRLDAELEAAPPVGLPEPISVR